MDALAVPDNVLVSASAIEAWCAQAVDAILRSSDPAVITDASQRAQAVKALAKIRKVSGDVASACVKVEAYALQRLWILGDRRQAVFGNSAAKVTAQRLASITPTELGKLLADEEFATPFAIGRHIERRNAVEWEKAHTDWLPARGTNWWKDALDVRRSAALILDRVADVGEPFTVDEAAHSLLEELDVDLDDLRLVAARELVSEALRQSESDEDWYTQLPRFVTFREFYNHVDGADSRWLRLPIRKASLAQLQWMAAYRAEQAAQLTAAAERLQKACNKLEKETRRIGVAPEDFVLGEHGRLADDDEGEVA